MRDTWLLFLDEADAILLGHKVLRFWRGDGTRGIDVTKVFLEPREFDLLYWIQGSAAAQMVATQRSTTVGGKAVLLQAANSDSTEARLDVPSVISYFVLPILPCP